MIAAGYQIVDADVAEGSTAEFGLDFAGAAVEVDPASAPDDLLVFSAAGCQPAGDNAMTSAGVGAGFDHSARLAVLAIAHADVVIAVALAG